MFVCVPLNQQVCSLAVMPMCVVKLFIGDCMDALLLLVSEEKIGCGNCLRAHSECSNREAVQIIDSLLD